MPGMRIQGKPSLGGAGDAPQAFIGGSYTGTSSFDSMVQAGMSGGPDPFARLSTEQRANLAGNPNQSWQAAQTNLAQMIYAAQEAIRRGSAEAQNAVYRAIHAGNFLDRYGGMTPLLQQHVSGLNTRAGGNLGSLVPVQQAGGASAAAADPVLRVLNDIDKQEHKLVDAFERVFGRPTAGGGGNWSGGGGGGGVGGWGGGGGPPGPWTPGPPGSGPWGGGRGNWTAGLGLTHGWAITGGGNMYGPPPPPGGGGGGGGWGAIPIPFAGQVGFGNTGAALGRGLGLALGFPEVAALEAAVKVFEEVALAPQKIAGAEEAAWSAATPAYRMQSTAASLGSAGRFSGRHLLGKIYSGKEEPFDWMAQLGLSTEQALTSYQNFGIFGGVNPVGIMKGLGALNGRTGLANFPGLGGLPEGMIEGMASKGAQYGVVTPSESGILKFGKAMSDALVPALRDSLNSTEILKTIAEGVTRSAQGGVVAASYGSMASFIQPFTSMGERSGAGGAQFAAGLSNFADQVGYDPAKTIAFNSRMSSLKTPDQMKQFLESSEPGLYDNLMKNPVSSEMMDSYFKAVNSGDTLAASSILSELLKNHPAVMASIATNNSVVNSFKGPMSDVVAARQLGVPISQIVAYRQGANRKVIDSAVSAASAKTGLPKSLLTSMIYEESRFRNGQISSAGAMGLTQMMPGTAAHEGVYGKDIMDPFKNIMGGSSYLEERIAAYGGDVEKGLEDYNWGPGKNNSHMAAIRAGVGVPESVRAYAQNIITRAATYKDLDAEDVGKDPEKDLARSLRTSANVGAARTLSSFVSLREANAGIPTINRVLDNVAHAAAAFADAMQKQASAANNIGGKGLNSSQIDPRTH